MSEPEFPGLILPDDFFADGIGVLVPDAGPVQNRKPSLAQLLNNIRAGVGPAGSYFVHPTKTRGVFNTIPEAYEAGRQELAPGEPIFIFVYPGAAYRLDFELKNTHDVYLFSVEPGQYADFRTRVFGTLDFEPIDISRGRRFFSKGIGWGNWTSQPVTVNGNYGWWMAIQDALCNAATFNRTHKLVSPYRSCELQFKGCDWQNYFRIRDQNNVLGGGVLKFTDCGLIMDPSISPRAIVQRGGPIYFTRCLIDTWAGGTGGMIDKAERSGQIYFEDCTFKFFAFDLDVSIYENPPVGDNQLQVYWIGHNTFSDMFVLGSTLRFPHIAGALTHIGAPDIISAGFDVAGEPPLGTRRRDYAGGSYKDKFWDGLGWS